MARTEGYTKTKRDYAQLDNRCDEHPKIAALTDREYRIWTRSILYCSRNLTDGWLALAVVKDRGWWKYAAALVAKRVWDEAVDQNYYVHDYLDWNDSKEDVLARIAKARTAGRSQSTSKSKHQEAPVETLNGHSESSTRDSTRSTTGSSLLLSSSALRAPDSLSPISHGELAPAVPPTMEIAAKARPGGAA